MGELSVKCQIEVPASIVYKGLKESYLDARFLDACKESKGYIPSIQVKEDILNRKLVFFVSGRDSLTKVKVGSWEWSFIIEEISSSQTRITLSYSWGILMGFLGAGTIYHQATNEATENIRFFIALETGYKSART